MATTRTKIREQVQLLYDQFLEKNSFDDNIDARVIDLHISQAINKYLRVQVGNNLKVGNYELPSCNILEYTLTPTSNKVTLPVYPMSLPLDMGVWSCALVSAPTTYFIPIPSAYLQVFGGTGTAFLESQTGYSVKNNIVSFTTNVTTPVIVSILNSDFDVTGETDILPISPDMELDVINEVLSLISNGKISLNELNAKGHDN